MSWLDSIQDLWGWQTEQADTRAGKSHPQKRQPQVLQDSVHQVTIAEQTIAYTLVRSQRQSVGLQIKNNALIIRAHPKVTLAYIEQVIQTKSNWILRHLGFVPAHKPTGQQRVPKDDLRRRDFVPDLQFVEGQIVCLLGSQVSIRYANAHFAPEFYPSESLSQGQAVITLKPSQPVLYIKRETANAQRQAQAVSVALCGYLRRYAQTYLDGLQQQHAATEAVGYKELQLSNARTLWGTCRNDGLIRLNWRLLFVEESVAQYVMAHELAHTVYMNHSAAFWQLVARMCPDYKQRERVLKQYDLRGSLI